jgi:hypothetical protein
MVDQGQIVRQRSKTPGEVILYNGMLRIMQTRPATALTKRQGACATDASQTLLSIR